MQKYMRKTTISHIDSCETPYYLVDEKHLRENLELIRRISDRSQTEFILAFKAFALWKTFEIFRDYITHTTASSVNEAQLSFLEFGTKAHTYSPAYEKKSFNTILKCSSHITFNSWSQFETFESDVRKYNESHNDQIYCGIRINPEYSNIKTTLYNPCAPGSRFGVLAKDMPSTLPQQITGLHCHNHCESSAEDFVQTIAAIEEKFGKWLPKIKWINFGGGHLVTREGYNTELLIRTLCDFHKRHPNVKTIMEPGSAFAWQTGALVAEVVDIVKNHDIATAIVNVSFTCHMPDCLEMPYNPYIQGAMHVDESKNISYPYLYRIGGNSCLSGDFMGLWQFDHPLSVGEKIIFEDMIHYTTVKTNMFNGIEHPAIFLQRADGTLQCLRKYTYEDYKNRMC